MKRFLPLIIIAAVALLTVGIGAVIYRAKMQPPPAPVASLPDSATPALTPAPEEAGHVRGPGDAPVTLEIYGDFQCPSCAVVSKGIDELQEQHKGKIRVIFRQFPLAMHKHAMAAARAAEASAIQGKFWEMHDMLYSNQPAWAEATNATTLFESYAERIGLDVARFRADCRAFDVRTHLREAIADGDRRGIKYTPTVFINGTQLRSGFTKGELQTAIDAALTPKKAS